MVLQILKSSHKCRRAVAGRLQIDLVILRIIEKKSVAQKSIIFKMFLKYV